MFICFSILAFVNCLLYGLLILFYNKTWLRLKKFDDPLINPQTFISIIVAARNEQNNIATLLNCLCQQNYPQQLFEIIVVNDNSEDQTFALVNTFCEKNKLPLQLIDLKSHNGAMGKKAAITTGVSLAKGELIITTDADCYMNHNWLTTMVSFFEIHHPKMIIGPVLFTGESSFAKMQALEQLSLTASAAASLSGGFPLMCNGANLAYTKEVFQKINGYENRIIASGDDTFLMFDVANKFPDSIRFIKSMDAVVYTKAETNFRNFVSQRLRWASKVSRYRNKPVLLTGAVIFLINAVMLFCIAAGFFDSDFFAIAFAILVCRTIFDYYFLKHAASFYNLKKYLNWMVPVEIIYPFYILFIAVASQLIPYKWKGRIRK